MGCPSPRCRWTAAPCPGASTAHTVGPLRVEPQHGPAHGRAPLPPVTASPGNPTHAGVSRLWDGGSSSWEQVLWGRSRDPRTPDPERTANSESGARGSGPAEARWGWAGRTPRAGVGRPERRKGLDSALGSGAAAGRAVQRPRGWEGSGASSGRQRLLCPPGPAAPRRGWDGTPHPATEPQRGRTDRRCGGAPVPVLGGSHPTPVPPGAPWAWWHRSRTSACHHVPPRRCPALAPRAVPPRHATPRHATATGQRQARRRGDTPPPRAVAHPAEAEGVGLVPGDAVVADERVGEHQDLRLVGGVGERLGVPHHAALEHCGRGERRRVGCDRAPRPPPAPAPPPDCRSSGSGRPPPSAAVPDPVPVRPRPPHSPTSPAAAVPAAPKGRPRSTDPSCSTRQPMAAPRALRRLRGGGDRARRVRRGGGGGGGRRIRGGSGPGQPPRRGGAGRGGGSTWRSGRRAGGGAAGQRRAGAGWGPGGWRSAASTELGVKAARVGNDRERRERPGINSNLRNHENETL